MLNQELFELVVAVKDTDFICYPIISQYQKKQQIESDDFEWVHIVYAIYDEEPLVFYIRFMNNTTELPEYRFTEYVSQVNKTSFIQLLYLVSYYGFFKEDENKVSIFKNNDHSNNNYCYFENTFGKLLYHYQLEQLYCSLTQSNIEEAVKFRKAINLKRHGAYEKAKTIVLPTGESLFEIITQYRHRDFTLYPKIKEAIALYNYLNL
jgi:hypothetical protein